MEKQTEHAEMEALTDMLAESLGHIRGAHDDTCQRCREIRTAAESLTPRLAADRAAAEARGAKAVLDAVEGLLSGHWRPRGDILAAARAAAMTISSEESSSLATRVPQDESQRRGVEGDAR
jgi:hypothetical protein